MGGHKTISGSTTITDVTPSYPPYKITGNPNPDCRGLYIIGGTFNGQPYYKRLDSVYYIYWTPTGNTWYISKTLGLFGGSIWFKSGSGFVTGIYFPNAPYTGNPKIEVT